MSQLREHLSIHQPLCFSGLLVDPHRLGHYDLIQCGVRYVFWLSGGTRLSEDRLKECLKGEGDLEMQYDVLGMQYDSTGPSLNANIPDQSRTWNVRRMTPGDAMEVILSPCPHVLISHHARLVPTSIFPPGTFRIYYSITLTFSISGSFLCRSSLHLTSQHYFRSYHLYPRHLQSFRHLVLCMVSSINTKSTCF